MTSLPAGVDKAKGEVKKTQEALSSAYELVKLWDEDSKTWLIRRKKDSQLFLGYPYDFSPQFASLLERGAGDAMSALLNHANLVNIISNVPIQVFHGSTKDRVEYFSVWEFCNAGSLAEFFNRPQGTPGVPVAEETGDGRVKRFLPESLIWHVAISMLRALAWLHEGYREEPCMQGDGILEYESRRAEVGRDGSMGEDWMPILHRNIRSNNIFFQHPRGSETYGYCKLGNFSRVFVSGHVHNAAGGKVVCSEDDTVPLHKLRQHMAVKDIFTVPKNERPYFKGTELYHLGEVLYQMMTRKNIPDKEECVLCGGRHHEPNDPKVLRADCPFGKHFVLADELSRNTVLEYSPQLIELVYKLLDVEYRGSGSFQARQTDAISFLSDAKRGYTFWRRNYEDGKLYRGHEDDELLRAKNKITKEMADLDSAQRQSGPDAMDVLGW